LKVNKGEFILLSNAGHRTVTEFTGSLGDVTVAAVTIATSRGTRDVDIGSGNHQLDTRDKDLALSTLLQDGDFLLLDDGCNSGC